MQKLSPRDFTPCPAEITVCIRAPRCYNPRPVRTDRTADLPMSQHRSLRASSTLGAKRNVLKRYERVELLKKAGQWKAGDRVTGLRKTKPPV